MFTCQVGTHVCMSLYLGDGSHTALGCIEDAEAAMDMSCSMYGAIFNSMVPGSNATCKYCNSSNCNEGCKAGALLSSTAHRTTSLARLTMLTTAIALLVVTAAFWH
eukprot:scaffold57625_cov32-Prasinocladus_malaysianus.AAC.1